MLLGARDALGRAAEALAASDTAAEDSPAELAVAFKNRGVVGFDLAGAEYNNPAKLHREAFYLIRNNNINVTIHAGEAYGPESIHQSIHHCGAHRIGHGTRLRENGDAAEAGDVTLLPAALEGASPREIEATFGTEFAAAFAGLETGAWAGPVASSYGLHLVRVSEHVPSRLPDLDEVRPAVEREWGSERRREATDRFEAGLRERYEIEVRLPDARPVAQTP